MNALRYGDIIGLEEIKKQFKLQKLSYVSSNEYELLKHTINLNNLSVEPTYIVKNKEIYTKAESLYMDLKNELLEQIGFCVM